MRNLVVLAVTCAAGSAAASPCVVNVAHASDEVRDAIEQWVDKESRCGGPLEVRVVPTDGGLYLFARDQRGRVRERLVPDATAAGVLVASWMADDSVAESAGIDVHVDVDVTAQTPPAETPPLEDKPPVTATAMAEPAPAHGPSMMLAGIVGAGDGGSATGVRGEADIVRLGGWTLGAAFAVEHGGMRFDATSPTGGMWTGIATSDLKALAYLVRPIPVGRWELRPALAFGAESVTAHVAFSDYPPIVMNGDYHKVFPTAEVGCTFFRHFGDGWDVGGGPVVGLLAQSIWILDGETVENMHRSLELMLELGVRHRL